MVITSDKTMKTRNSVGQFGDDIITPRWNFCCVSIHDLHSESVSSAWCPFQLELPFNLHVCVYVASDQCRINEWREGTPSETDLKFQRQKRKWSTKKHENTSSGQREHLGSNENLSYYTLHEVENYLRANSSAKVRKTCWQTSVPTNKANISMLISSLSDGGEMCYMALDKIF